MGGLDDKLSELRGMHYETYISTVQTFPDTCSTNLPSHLHLEPQLLNVHMFKGFSLTKILSSLAMCWATVTLGSYTALPTFVEMSWKSWLIGTWSKHGWHLVTGSS